MRQKKVVVVINPRQIAGTMKLHTVCCGREGQTSYYVECKDVHCDPAKTTLLAATDHQQNGKSKGVDFCRMQDAEPDRAGLVFLPAQV